MDIVASKIRLYKLNNDGGVVQKFRGLVTLGDIGMTKPSIDTDDFDKKYTSKTGGKPNIEDVEVNTKVDPISHDVIVTDFISNENSWYGIEYPDGVKELSCKVQGNILSWKDTGFTGNSLINTVFNLGINDYDYWTPPVYKLVTGITPESDSIDIVGVGGTENVMVTVEPADATDKDLFVSSSNTSIATVTVSKQGTVTIKAVALGTCVVNVMSADGGFLANINVTVGI